MNIYKKFFVVLNFIFLTIMLSNLGYSACSNKIDYINIKSGSYDLGNVGSNQQVFIKPELNKNPLSVEFGFLNADETCFSDSSVTFQLVPSGQFTIGSKSVENLDNGTLTKFNFVFSPNFKISTSLTSKYKISTSAGETVGTFVFRGDDNKPSLTISGIDESKTIKAGDEIRFDYSASDSESGLGKIIISGGKTFLYDYVQNQNLGEPAPTFYNDTPKSSKTYRVKVEDKLGNFIEKTVSVNVDSKAPIIKDIDKIYTYKSNQRFVKLKVTLQDESFVDGLMPTLVGDFSLFNSNANSESAVCSAYEFDNELYICEFNDILISDISSTQNIKLIFTATDGVGNTADISKNEEIFIDASEPEIIEFNVYNSLGVKNKVSIFDKNITVKLIAKDKSLIEPRLIIEDFGEIQFAPEKDCGYNSDSGVLNCVWNIGNTIEAYAGFNELESTNFTVVVVDNYGNSAQDRVNILFDSEAPQLDNIELRINNDIITGVLQSQDNIEFRITLNDSGIVSAAGEQFVFGDFSKIDYEDSSKNKKGNCFLYNEQTVCDFINIKVENGYFKENVTFYVSDIFGNKNKFNYEVEVFAISDEIRNSFDIDDLYILNPISRDRMISEAVTTWFEGVIETKEEGIEIVNYQFLGCNETEIEPLSLIPGEDRLYPTDIVYYHEKGDEKFALKIRLKDHRAMADLNLKNVTCEMSVLKRDSTQIFPVEKVQFKIIIDFFNSQRGGINQALAKDIIADIEDADLLGEEFDQIYDVYEMLNSVCTTVNSATGIMSGINSVWTMASVALYATGYGSAVAYPIDNVLFPADGMLSTLNSGVIAQFCDMITCRNGGLIGGFGGSTGLGEWLDDVNDMTSQVCSFSLNGGKEDEE